MLLPIRLNALRWPCVAAGLHLAYRCLHGGKSTIDLFGSSESLEVDSSPCAELPYNVSVVGGCSPRGGRLVGSWALMDSDGSLLTEDGL